MSLSNASRRANARTIALVGVFVFFFVFAGLAISHNGLINLNSEQSGSAGLFKSVSGLVASDPLDSNLNQTQLATGHNWIFNGDAPFIPNAEYAYYEDSSGLHIGVQSPNGTVGQYAGYYAEWPDSNFVLAHITITAPVRALDQNALYESGLYVQTADGNVTYVSCASITNDIGTTWEVVQAYGNTTQTTQTTVLYQDTSPNQSLTRSCTIITNGNNYLKVYLDNSLVYNSTTMNLMMPQPLQIYLEPQSTYTREMLNSTFQDFYITSGEDVSVTNLPSTATQVVLLNPENDSILASANVVGGTASIPVGNFTFPIQASIEVLNSSQLAIVSTNGTVPLYGGDVYQYGTSPPPAIVPLTINTVNQNGGTIGGYYVTLSAANGTLLMYGFSSPVVFDIQSSTSYVVTPEGYGNVTFACWQDTRSTAPSRTVSITAPTNLTAIYTTIPGVLPSACSASTTTTGNTTTTSVISTTTITTTATTTATVTYSNTTTLTVQSPTTTTTTETDTETTTLSNTTTATIFTPTTATVTLSNTTTTTLQIPTTTTTTETDIETTTFSNTTTATSTTTATITNTTTLTLISPTTETTTLFTPTTTTVTFSNTTTLTVPVTETLTNSVTETTTETTTFSNTTTFTTTDLTTITATETTTLSNTTTTTVQIPTTTTETDIETTTFSNTTTFTLISPTTETTTATVTYSNTTTATITSPTTETITTTATFSNTTTLTTTIPTTETVNETITSYSTVTSPTTTTFTTTSLSTETATTTVTNSTTLTNTTTLTSSITETTTQSITTTTTAVSPTTETVTQTTVSPTTVTVTVTSPTSATTTTTTTTYNQSAGQGLLRVQSNPAVWTSISVNGVPRNDWGIDWLPLTAGNYSISFTDVPGFVSPSMYNVTFFGQVTGSELLPIGSPIPVYANTTTQVIINFEQEGSLRIQTSPPTDAIVYVNGIAMNPWGAWVSLVPGTYTVSFQNITGLSTPQTVNVQVNPGEETLVIGSYNNGTTSVSVLLGPDKYLIPSQQQQQGNLTNASPENTSSWNEVAIVSLFSIVAAVASAVTVLAIRRSRRSPMSSSPPSSKEIHSPSSSA